MAVEDDMDSDRRRKSEQDAKKESLEKSSKKKRPLAPEVGNALRSAYDQAVNEDIPPEMLDLLGKLG